MTIKILIAGTDLAPSSNQKNTDGYYDKGRNPLIGPRKTPEELSAMRRINNPGNKPVGHNTGRCHHCGSSDLWDDNLAYGCNSCKAMLSGN